MCSTASTLLRGKSPSLGLGLGWGSTLSSFPVAAARVSSRKSPCSRRRSKQLRRQDGNCGDNEHGVPLCSVNFPIEIRHLYPEDNFGAHSSTFRIRDHLSKTHLASYITFQQLVCHNESATLTSIGDPPNE